MEPSLLLANWTTDNLRSLFHSGARVAALVPVGSVEPHGPHLPLSTDTLISSAAAERAAALLTERGIQTLIAPAVAYGVTRFADGFAGAVSVPPDALTAFLRAIATGLLDTGFAHVCFINNHLEPDHDAAVRTAAAGFPPGRVSVASPLTRRWARTLSPEFKSGACHAGRYETSLILAASPAFVDTARAEELPNVDISLSDGIRAGQTSFRAMGIDKAYTGAPREASAAEGRELLERLAEMVATEVEEARCFV
jgi:creatinine amidohydrolase